MADATERLIDAIRDHGNLVKAAGEGAWIARCPAHPDGRPSLSIRRGRGRALLFCFASCATDDIAAAVGLRMEDLFDDPKGVDYEYRAQGKLVRTVHRSPAKVFAQSIVDKEQVVLYVPPGVDLAEAVRSGKEILLPEGEQDADTLVAAGMVAVSSPMGASAWARCDYTPLRGAAALTVVADRDEPGVQRAKGLSKRLAELSSTVRVIQSKVGKDATDHIVAGFGRGDFVELEVEPEEVDTEFEEQVRVQQRYYAVTAEAKRREAEAAAKLGGITLKPKTLGEILELTHEYHWLIPGLLERQDRLVLTGGEGSGKSWFLRQIAIAAAAGVHPLSLWTKLDPLKVLVVDAENSEMQWNRATSYLTRLVERVGAGTPRQNVIVNAGMRLDFTKTADVAEVHRLMDEHQPDLLYIGPLYKLMPKAIMTDDEAAPLITVLDGFRERGVAMLMEAHAGHSRDDMRPRGSSALLGWPEFGLGLRPVEDDETMVSVVRWRGDREERDWPRWLRRGIEGELPWMAADL